MPNWVFNEVTIKADREDLTAFLERHFTDDGRFDFATIIPIDIPMEEYHGNQEIKLADGSSTFVGGEWYKWNTAHWGTKWNSSNTITDSFLETGWFYFDTAWSNPIPIQRALAKMYPTFDIEWKYVEEQGWGGVSVYEDGREVITKRRMWDIPTTHEERMEIFDYCYACEDGDEEDMEMYGCPRVTASV